MVGGIGFAIVNIIVIAALLIASDKKKSAAQVAHWSKGALSAVTLTHCFHYILRQAYEFYSSVAVFICIASTSCCKVFRFFLCPGKHLHICQGADKLCGWPYYRQRRGRCCGCAAGGCRCRASRAGCARLVANQLLGAQGAQSSLL